MTRDCRLYHISEIGVFLLFVFVFVFLNERSLAAPHQDEPLGTVFPTVFASLVSVGCILGNAHQISTFSSLHSVTAICDR